MKTTAVVLQEPHRLALRQVDLLSPGESDVIVDMEWTGISTGTEKLLWSGRMPSFPGMGYPLVPGYESVGRVRAAGPGATLRAGDRVFVPGAQCYDGVRGLFGGAAGTVVVPSSRAFRVSESTGEQAVLLALAATAQHALSALDSTSPDLIVGHGVLGRLIARLAVLQGGAPTVWERDAARRAGAIGYAAIDPEQDPRRDYRSVIDVSGDAAILDALIARLAPGGTIVLAGFYAEPLSFAFPPAFMREVRIRVAAEWRHEDMTRVLGLVEAGRLSLDGLITHRHSADQAEAAYGTAFTDPNCLKMILDWRLAS
jgi:3-hydroxyethyl bacteriochlorophyllide a dehydrogenase